MHPHWVGTDVLSQAAAALVISQDKPRAEELPVALELCTKRLHPKQDPVNHLQLLPFKTKDLAASSLRLICG
jgi:hypothetical protein